jgi:hypothetical protein
MNAGMDLRRHSEAIRAAIDARVALEDMSIDDQVLSQRGRCRWAAGK